MKIAQIVMTFPPHIGGMGEVCFHESEILSLQGHDVTVYTLNHGNFLYNDSDYSFKIIRLFPLVHLGDAGFVPQLFFKLKNYDVVHLHYPFYGGAEWAMLAAGYFKKKLVVTYHMDAEPKGIMRKVVQKGYDTVVPHFIFKHAEKIITVDRNHLLHSRFGSQIHSSKVVEIYNGVDTEIYNPNVKVGVPENVKEWGKEKKVFLFIGNPLPFKRLDFILQAFRLISDLQIVLAVISDGYEIEKYKKLAEELGLLPERVKFVGRVKNSSELNQYFQIAQSLIVASAGNAESFALVSIEALSAGCPVVASNIPGVSSRIDDKIDGLLFNPHSLNDLVQNIKTMANYTLEEREKMAKLGRAKVVANYTWVQHGKKLIELYHNL